MTKRIFTVLLAVLLAVSLIPISAVSAADPGVEIVDGIRTVFISSFGRVSYAGGVYTAFRNIEDALAALGPEGGKIAFSGTLDMESYVNASEGAPIQFEGVGDRPSSSVLNFGTSAFLRGDTYVSNLTINTEPDIPIYTGGHLFSTVGKVECHFVETFVQNGSNTIVYDAPFIFAVGDYASELPASPITLTAGHYKAAVAGSHGASNVNGDTQLVIGGGIFESIYAGNYVSSGTFRGNADVTVQGGDIANVIAGSDGGATDANLTVTLSGGTINKLSVGSPSGDVVNGNVCVRFEGSAVSDSIVYRDTIAGKVIFIDGANARNIPHDYDYLIRTENATVVPAYDGTTLTGFHVGDQNGFIPAKVYANGTEISQTNGLFQLPEGEVTITCEPAASVENVDKAAQYIKGYDDGTFLPQNNITRAEAMTMLARIICSDITVLPQILTCSYTDVPSDSWYYGVVGLFEKLGFLEKMESDFGRKISPEQYITRAEFSELSLHVISKLYDARLFGVVFFPDVASDNPYGSAIGQLGYLGVISGYEDGSFGPDKNITRAEAVTIINRFLGRTPTGNAGTVTFSDIEGHWAADQIIAACNPAQNGDTAVWTLTDDITKGSYTMLSGEDVTVGDRIRDLREKAQSLGLKDTLEGVDAIAKQHIDDIVNAKSEYPVTGTLHYVSPNGNDSNDGLSPETAWQTLSRLEGMVAMRDIKAGDAVLFERGGEWRGRLVCIPGVTYSAYGEGPKPVINSSVRNYADPSLWLPTEAENIYRCTEPRSNVGIMAFDFTGVLGDYNQTLGTRKLAGLDGVTSYLDLTRDLEFFSDLSSGQLYLYCVGGNPGTRFSNIEIGGEGHSISISREGNVVVDNLTVRLTGTHGLAIGNLKDVTVQNCIFDYLGGSVLRGFGGGNTVRFGNALQVYGGCDGWYLYNNWIYQIYDTAVTHQYSSSIDRQSALMDNVRYVGNVIELCHWSIEYYNPDFGGTKHTFHNTYIADNICRLNGYGWGSVPRRSTAYLVQSAGITEDTKNFVIENNIFDRSSGALINIQSGGDRKLEQHDNVWIQNYGGVIGLLFGSTVNANANAKENYERIIRDTTSLFFVNDDTSVINYYPNVY